MNTLTDAVDQIMAALRAGDLSAIEAADAWEAEKAKPDDSEPEATIQGLFNSLEKWGAATVRLVPRDKNDVALRAVIAVQGQPETDEVLAALDLLEERWHDE